MIATSLVVLLAGCSPAGPTGNTELNVIVPNGAPGSPLAPPEGQNGSSAPNLIDIQVVEYTIVCDGGNDVFLGSSLDTATALNGVLEVVDERPAPPDSTLTNSEVWQSFMDLPVGWCTVQLRARDNDDEVICTATQLFAVAADTVTKVDVLMLCDASFQAPVGMVDLDASFSFGVSNFCPDLFVFNTPNAAPIERDVGESVLVAQTTVEVRFRDADSTCGQSCDPQTCTTTPSGIDCAPGPDPGVSTTITCVGGQLDCDGDGTIETECVLSGDELGVLGGDSALNASAFVRCIPLSGGEVTCTAHTTDGDLDCDKTKVLTISCPGEPLCDNVVCPDNGIPCVTDVCDPSDGSCQPAIDPDASACDPPGGVAGTGTCEAGVCTTSQTDGFCTMPLAFNEPLCNPSYDDTLWPGSHRGSYAQGSAAGPGPAAGTVVTPQHIELPGAPIITSFSEPYADGGRAVWSTILGPNAPILKLDHDTFQVVDIHIPEGVTVPLGVSGAYTAVDANSDFIVGRTNFVSVFGDSVQGNRFSPIELKKRLFFTTQTLCGASDLIAGMALTFDGHIAFVTERGNVFVVPLDADQDDVIAGLPVISTNVDCATADPADLELVSNSIATDENGGIYVVTSAAMYGFRWDGATLSQEWRVPYDSDPDVSPIRLGPGSGQTPSLMGTAADDDRFVVIADGKTLMNMLLIWRDEIPVGWQPIAPGKDPRIACEVPVLFGDPARTEAISEQSIAVRGYSAILVNDLVSDPTIVDPGTLLAPVAQNLVSALEAGLPAKAPMGMERVDWDPVSQTCSTVWANPSVVIPNGIPSISAQSNLVYGLGLRGAQWGVEGLDFDTGASVVWAPGGSGACDPTLIAVPRQFFPDVDALLATEVLPGSGITLDQTACENSLYAATTVGPDGSIYTGTFFGMSKYSPDVVPAASESVQARAGVGQALDLLSRAQRELGLGKTVQARDFVGRASRQTSASIAPATLVGPPVAVNDVVAAAASVTRALSALDSSLDPSADIAQAIGFLNSAAAQLN